MNKFTHLPYQKKLRVLPYIYASVLDELFDHLTFVILLVTTPIVIKDGWLCCKEFDQAMK